MSKAPIQALPDMDDVEFAARLKPLEQAVLATPGRPVIRTPGNSTIPTSGLSDNKEARVVAAQRLGKIERARGPKRRYEYLIPERVGDALATDAAQQKKSAATRLLEILRDAGYPVIPEDFIDLRKEKGRG